MHFTTLLLPLACALAVSADPLLSSSLPQGISPAHRFQHFSGAPERRDTPDVDPEILCGKKYKDCGNGWCCSAREECAGEIAEVPVCKDPTVTYGLLGGTEVAMPYNDLDNKLSSLSAALVTITGGPQAGGGGATNTAQSKQNGAAASTGLDGFGSMAALVLGIWSAAAVGGAGIFFL